jgi:hypothetical protein
MFTYAACASVWYVCGGGGAGHMFTCSLCGGCASLWRVWGVMCECVECEISESCVVLCVAVCRVCVGTPRVDPSRQCLQDPPPPTLCAASPAVLWDTPREHSLGAITGVRCGWALERLHRFVPVVCHPCLGEGVLQPWCCCNSPMRMQTQVTPSCNVHPCLPHALGLLGDCESLWWTSGVVDV